MEQKGKKMKNLKTVITGGVLLTALAGLIAMPVAMAAGTHDEEAAPSSANEFWEHMNQMRNIMHWATVNSEPLADGVRIVVTGTQPELIASIQQEFDSGRHEVKAPAPNTEVAAESLENGVALTFLSEDSATVEGLQARGTGLFYDLLRENMHDLMAGQGGPGRMRGRGMMGGGWGFGSENDAPCGFGKGMGYGPGRRGQGMGYGPGRHGQGMGYGSGMYGAGMGGWGPSQ